VKEGRLSAQLLTTDRVDAYAMYELPPATTSRDQMLAPEGCSLSCLKNGSPVVTTDDMITPAVRNVRGAGAGSKQFITVEYNN
jgi:hypothetical protein